MGKSIMENQPFKIPRFILASKNIRIINYLVDSVIVYFVVLILISLIDEVFMTDKITFAYRIDSFEMSERYLFWAIAHFFYYGITEIFFSRSLAKYLTKTIVVSENGMKPHIVDILARTTLRIVPFEPLTFLNGRNQGFHDEYSKTFVVRKNKLEKSIFDFIECRKTEEI